MYSQSIQGGGCIPGTKKRGGGLFTGIKKGPVSPSVRIVTNNLFFAPDLRSNALTGNQGI